MRTPIALMGIALTVVFAGCGAEGASPTPTPTQEPRLEVAAEACDVADHVDDGGKSITLNATKGYRRDEGDVSFEVARCLFGEIDMPQHVISHIESTRALDGQQSDEWDDYAARWTYHPDAGLRIIIVDDRI